MNIKYFVVFSWRQPHYKTGLYEMGNIFLSGSNQLSENTIRGFEDYIAERVIGTNSDCVIVTNIIPLNELGTNPWD